MTFRTMRFGGLLLLVFASVALGAEPVHLKCIEPNPKTGTSAVVIVGDRALIHTSQILPGSTSGRLENAADSQTQINQVFRRLETVLAGFGVALENTVKLNVYVRDASIREQFEERLTEKFPGSVKPAVCFVATPLPDHEAVVALDAVVAARADEAATEVTFRQVPEVQSAARFADAALLPRGDVVYVSGQAEQGDLREATRQTLRSLERTLEHVGLNRSHIVQIKCFLRPMSETAVVKDELAIVFNQDPVPPVSYVEWISSNAIEIELVAYAPHTESAESVIYFTPPGMKASPIFSRVARIHGDRRIYVSGLVADSAGDGKHEVRSLFASLQSLLNAAGSDLRHLAKATYYVSGDDASQQLNLLRPTFYDPQRPPAASKAMVKDVGWPNRTLTFDMIAALARRAVDAGETAGDSEPTAKRLSFQIERTVARSGFDGKTCWVHARAGAIPPGTAGNPTEMPVVVMTMQQLLLSGSDVFYELHEMRTDNLAKTWEGPRPHGNFGRQKQADGAEVTVCDFTPKWHAATGKLLGIGHTVQYKENRVMSVRNRATAFSVYDPLARTWSDWQTLKMPNSFRFANAGAGCVQRFDLPNGDILLPIYFKEPDEKQYSTTVCRCRFDGLTLQYVEHGNELTVDVQRGLYEPSLTKLGDRYFLTTVYRSGRPATVMRHARNRTGPGA